MTATLALCLFIAVGVSVAVVYTQYFFRVRFSYLILLLASLRFLSIALFVLLILDPKVETTVSTAQKPKLFVLADDSESISRTAQNKTLERALNGVKASAAISTNYDVSYYKFGDKLELGDALSFKKKQTDIAKALESIQMAYADQEASVILITDGNSTIGKDYRYAELPKLRVFPLVIGDTISHPDLEITALNVNKYVQLKNDFIVEVFLNYTGVEPLNSTLKIASEGKTYFTKTVAFSKQNNSIHIQATIPSERLGVRSYSVSLLPLEGEKHKANNSKDFAIESIDKRASVAIVSRIVHPDIGALLKSIGSNKQYAAKVVDPKTFFENPDTYNTAVFYQPDSSFERAISTSEKSGKNYWMIFGRSTDWTFINKVQGELRQPPTHLYEKAYPMLDQAFGLYALEDLKFEELPPLDSPLEDAFFKNGSKTLLKKVMKGIPTEAPLMAITEKQNTRKAFLFGEGIWKWRMKSYDPKSSFNGFDTFVSKLLSYLSSDEAKSRLVLDYQVLNYAGETVVKAQYFDSAYEPDSSSSLVLKVKKVREGKSAYKTIPMIFQNNDFSANLDFLDPGDYVFDVCVDQQSLKKTGQFTVLDYGLEALDSKSNHLSLEGLAEKTSGKAFYNASKLISFLETDNTARGTVKTQDKTTSLIEQKTILIALAAALFLEWLLRKYFGLV